MPDDLRPDDLDDDEVLRELRTLGARLGPPDGDDWEEPPAGLFDRIAAEAGVGPASVAGDDATGPPHDATGAPHDTVGAPGGATVHPLERRERPQPRRAPWLLAAAAAVLVVVGAVVLLRPSSDDGGTVVASADLEQLQDRGEGRAELVDRDGDLELRLDTSDLDPGDGFLEVWMIDTEVSRLVSLGPLRADGVYDLPGGVDPEAFPVVDVSAEPVDGDPAHSGDSLLRGQLTF